MEKGHPVEIISGKPIDKVDEPDNTKLQAAARYAGITQTAAGQLLIQEIEDFLIRRIEQLIDQDAEARAYKSMLAKMSYRENIGKIALNVLEKRLRIKK